MPGETADQNSSSDHNPAQEQEQEPDETLSQTDTSTVILDADELTAEERNLAASLDRRDN